MRQIERRKAVVICVMLWMLLLSALPVMAESEKAAANITPETTMGELRENSAIRGSGIFTYTREQDNSCLRSYWNGKTLREFVNRYTAEDCAKGLNRLIENYNAGLQITYGLYTEEEIEQEPSREKAEIYYFPGEGTAGERQKFALIVGGNALCTSAELREGVSTAAQLNEMGYTAFVLRYRVGSDAEDNGPLEDLGRAVQYITAHAEVFGVQPEGYALIGYSSGGQIAGIFASEKLGYRNYGASKPGVLLLAYPVNSFFEVKAVWEVLIDGGTGGPYYYEHDVSDCITADYPPVYHWYGRNDLVLSLLCTPMQGYTLEKALQNHGVPHRYRLFDNAPHSSGTGRGTDADGWLEDAVAFWEENLAVSTAG